MKTDRLEFGRRLAYSFSVEPTRAAGTGSRGGRKPAGAAETGEFSGGGSVLHYALVFFLVAIVAAVLGFGGVSVASAGIAKILFYMFLVIFLVTLVMGVARRA
jgi:uncharacterized membrane protein YtjA (UPF0391 family)